METISANYAASGLRQETLGGRPQLVTPMTMLVSGVLNGSNGPLFYPADEIAKAADAWNHMPLVVDHPQYGGQFISARRPDVLNAIGIGVVLNAQANGGKLVAEAWFDVEATQRVSPAVYTALVRGERLELSTGLRTRNEPAPAGAVYNSGSGPARPYTHVARNHKPDHLAVLPDRVGACPLPLCGVGVMNEFDFAEAFSTEEPLVMPVLNWSGNDAASPPNHGCGCGGGAVLANAEVEEPLPPISAASFGW